MPTSAIDILRANYGRRTEIMGELRQIDEAANTDNRSYTEDEQATITDRRSQLEEVDARIQANLEIETRSQDIEGGFDRFLGALADREHGDVVDTRSLGHRFTDTDEYRAFADRQGQGDYRSVRYEADGMDFRTVSTATVGSATSGGAWSRPALQARVGNDFLDRRVYLADMLPHTGTTDTAVVYVQDKSPLADMADKAVETAEGDAKPQAGITTAVVTEPIATVAAWVDMTRQVAADVPQIQGYLDGRLRYSIRRRADKQIINGTGSGATLTGLLARSGIVSYTPSGAEVRYKTIRHGIRLMEDAESVPEIIVLNPADAELFDLSNDTTTGLHAVPNVAGPSASTAWGLTQVRSTAIAAGTAMLIDPMAVQVYDRQTPTAHLTDSDASKFESNILTLLLEARLGLALFQPKGVAKLTFVDS